MVFSGPWYLALPLLSLMCGALYYSLTLAPHSLGRMAGIHFLVGCCVWVSFASFVLYTVGGILFAAPCLVGVVAMASVVALQGAETW